MRFPNEIATLDNLMAPQRMGQHFLGNARWQKRILESLPRAAKETWVEIGAGHGEMTHLLAENGRRVIAVEADTQLAAGLEDNAARWGDVEVVSGDVLSLDLRKIAGGRFRVYGNLPYYITSPILHQLFAYANQLASVHIVIQQEVAERIVAAPGRRDYGYLSATCQFYARPEIAFRIPPGAFRPPPRVNSALVHMTMPGECSSLEVADEKRFLKFIATCFGQKRKTLRNNLRGIMPDERIHAALADSGLRSDARAEQLSLAQFAAFFAQIG
jgi:16S rRNA (adenine1518-N6/adenine1519-N6)-dimethyltransferase